jgi:biotin transport system substrate-specific component
MILRVSEKSTMPAPDPTSARSPRHTARDLAQIAIFAALTAALGLAGAINVGAGGGVPITLQSLGVMLTGAILGRSKAALAMLVFLGVGLLGVPVFSGARTSWQALAGVSAGYAIGFVAGAFVIGWLTTLMVRRSGRYRIPVGMLINIIGGIGVIYLFGIPVTMIRADLGLIPAMVGALPFLPGDLAKAAVAALVAAGVHKAYPDLHR